MKKVLLAYDISMIKTAIAKEKFIEDLKRTHNLRYDFFESEGDLHSSNYVCVVQYSGLNDGVIITRIITVVYRQTLRDWWGYKGPILPAAFDNYDIGRL